MVEPLFFSCCPPVNPRFLCSISWMSGLMLIGFIWLYNINFCQQVNWLDFGTVLVWKVRQNFMLYRKFSYSKKKKKNTATQLSSPVHYLKWTWIFFFFFFSKLKKTQHCFLLQFNACIFNALITLGNCGAKCMLHVCFYIFLNGSLSCCRSTCLFQFLDWLSHLLLKFANIYWNVLKHNTTP